MSLSTCIKIVLKIDKRACFTKTVKSPRSLLKGPQESSPIVEGSSRRKPSLFIIKFLNGPRRHQQSLKNSRDRSCHSRPHWPKDHWSIFTRQLIQLLLSQVITPQAPKPRSHPWGFSIFLLFKIHYVCSFEFLGTCCLGFDYELIIGMFVWISCLHFSLKKNQKKKKIKKPKKNLSPTKGMGP